MKNRVMVFGWVLASSVLQTFAQTQVDLKTQGKSVDFSSASFTKPLKAGSALPATCSAGELYFQTNATPGANVYVCSATNVWTANGIASVFGRTGAVTAQPGDYPFFPTFGTAATDALVVWSSSGVLDSSTIKRDPSTGAIGFGKGLFLQPVTVAFNGGSPNLDLSTGNYFDLTVTGAATLTTSNGALVNGAQSFFTWHICQDGTGGWAVTKPAGFALASAIDTTANICTVQSFWWTGANAIPAAPAFTTQTAFFMTGPVRAAPGTPASTFMSGWLDSTGKNLQAKNDAAAISGTAFAKAAVSHQFLTSFDPTVAPASQWGQAQPASSDLSDYATVRAHSFGAYFSGANVANAQVSYGVIPFACTIASWSIQTDATTLTFKVWKVATGAGTAVPTVAANLNTSGLSLSSGTYVRSTAVTDFALGSGTAVAANDQYATWIMRRIRVPSARPARLMPLVVE